MSYIVPIGPYHPALEEPIHAKLYTEGEVIKDAEVFVGYNHRGIEKLATERNAIQTLVLVERVCGICSHSHAFTYAMCVEEINGVQVPKRGQYIRVITAELERLHSHFLWLGIACHIIPRKEIGGQAVSASAVRAAVQQSNMELARQLVPETTWRWLNSAEAVPVIERIRKETDVVHY